MRYGYLMSGGAAQLIRSEDGINWSKVDVATEDAAGLVARALNAYSDPEQEIAVPDSLEEIAPAG